MVQRGQVDVRLVGMRSMVWCCGSGSAMPAIPETLYAKPVYVCPSAVVGSGAGVGSPAQPCRPPRRMARCACSARAGGSVRLPMEVLRGLLSGEEKCARAPPAVCGGTATRVC